MSKPPNKDKCITLMYVSGKDWVEKTSHHYEDVSPVGEKPTWQCIHCGSILAKKGKK